MLLFLVNSGSSQPSVTSLSHPVFVKKKKSVKGFFSDFSVSYNHKGYIFSFTYEPFLALCTLMFN